MALSYTTVKMTQSYDWDELVRETYGKIYCFQQQDGCKSRGTFSFTVPDKADDFENDTVTEVVNHREMGVSFKAWLERDPEQKLTNKEDQDDWDITLWWQRNFYPDIQMIANDLHAKGLLEAGEYIINIDW